LLNGAFRAVAASKSTNWRNALARGSLTVAVIAIEEEIRKLLALGVDASKRIASNRVKTVMITGPRRQSHCIR
jgi:hypothetical protein